MGVRQDAHASSKATAHCSAPARCSATDGPKRGPCQQHGPRMQGGAAHAEGGAAHAEGGAAHAEGGAAHAEGGAAHAQGGAVHAGRGSACRAGQRMAHTLVPRMCTCVLNIANHKHVR